MALPWIPQHTEEPVTLPLTGIESSVQSDAGKSKEQQWGSQREFISRGPGKSARDLSMLENTHMLELSPMNHPPKVYHMSLSYREHVKTHRKVMTL